MTMPEPHPYRTFEHDGWQGAAARYGATFAHATAPYIGALLTATSAGPGVRLVDVACGPGLVAAEAARRGATPLGIDFSSAMLDAARRQFPDLAFQEGDAEALNLASASVDAVVSNFGVHHLPFPRRFVAEARRVLRPGGRFAATIWAGPADNVAWKIVFGAIDRHGDPTIDLPTSPHGKLNSPEACRALLDAAGFAAARIETQPVQARWHLASPDALLDGLLAGTVRMAALIRAQTPVALDRIRRDVAEAVTPFRQADAYVVPTSAILVSATATPSRGPD